MHHTTRNKKLFDFLQELLRFCVLSKTIEDDPGEYLDFYPFFKDNLAEIKRIFPRLLLLEPSEFLQKLVKLHESGKMNPVKVSVLLRFKKHLNDEDKSRLFDLCFSVAKTIDDYDRILQEFKRSLTNAQKQRLRERFGNFSMGKNLHKAIMRDLK